MKNLFKIGLIVFTLMFSVNTVNVYADNSYTISNDGNEKSIDEIYKDSGLPSSFSGAEYYDVAMPYNLSAFDVGGWCYASYDSNYIYSEEKLKGYKITGSVACEGTYSTIKRNSPTLMSDSFWDKMDAGHSTDSETGLEIITIDGVQFYIAAVQKFQYNYSKANDWFGGFTSSSNGYFFDVVLTDGTVIHFVKGDSNAERHTNGSTDGDGEDKVFDSGNNSNRWWSCRATKLAQYANIFGFSSCNSLEIWGDSTCVSKFTAKYNIGSKDDENRIAYYRLYNSNVETGITPVSNDVKSVSYKLGNVTLANGKKSTAGIDLAQTGKFAEGYFINVDSLLEVDLPFSSRDDLDEDQLVGVVDWKNNIDYGKEDSIIKYIRIFVMLFGILFLVWIVLIYLSYWFDRINNFVDIDLLPIITAGRLRISPEEHECTFNPKTFVKGQAQTVNHKVVIGICVIGLFFSVLTISGALYTILNMLVRKMLSLLGVI